MPHLIAIEGIDGSGKGTQAARLKDTLVADGHQVTLLSFPRYEVTQFGRAIGRFLNGEFGSLDAVHPQLAALLFAGDRFESKTVLEQALAESDVVICDRFVASNVAHQAAKLDEPQRSELMAWIETLEFETYALPRPDWTFLLDVSAAMAQQLIAKKAARSYTDKAADLQEADADYLDRVGDVYRALASHDRTWTTIGVEQDGRVRSLESITDEILKVMGGLLDSPPSSQLSQQI